MFSRQGPLLPDLLEQGPQDYGLHVTMRDPSLDLAASPSKETETAAVPVQAYETSNSRNKVKVNSLPSTRTADSAQHTEEELYIMDFGEPPHTAKKKRGDMVDTTKEGAQRSDIRQASCHRSSGRHHRVGREGEIHVKNNETREQVQRWEHRLDSRLAQEQANSSTHYLHTGNAAATSASADH